MEVTHEEEKAKDAVMVSELPCRSYVLCINSHRDPCDYQNLLLQVFAVLLKCSSIASSSYTSISFNTCRAGVNFQ